MGSVARRERQREELRGHILDAARELFVRDGFEAVTMRKIADAVEYSATALYSHFKDKEALLHELCELDLAAMNATIRAAAGTLVGLERLQVVAQSYVSFAMEHPAQYRLLFMVPKPGNQPQETLASPDRQAYQALREVFVGLVQGDILRPTLRDPDLLAQVYFCGLHGIVAAHIALNGSWPIWRLPQEQATVFVASLINGIAKESPDEHPPLPSPRPPQRPS